MIKYETNGAGKAYLEIQGSTTDIGCDAAYMLAIIYKDLFKKSPDRASLFRHFTMYAIENTMDAIERGEFSNDNYTT